MKVFYVKRMDGEDKILKEIEVMDIGDHKVDMFLASHGVNLYWYSTRRIEAAPWSDTTDWTVNKEWYQWHSVKGKWILIKESLVPQILLMRLLVGAL